MLYHWYQYYSNQTTWCFSYFFIGPHLDFATQVDDLLKQRDNIHCSFTVTKVVNGSGSGSGLSNGSSSKIVGEDSKAESPVDDGSSDGRDKSGKKKWFNLNLKGADKKLGWEGVWVIFSLWYYMCLKIHPYIQMFGPLGCCIQRLSLYAMPNFSVI